METGKFYFIKENYFIKFPDKYLMKNKEKINGKEHNRPCYFSFKDEKTKILWLIPFSSNLSKYKNVYVKKINKYKVCDTIVFGDVLGYKKAFLIQNICPIISKYIEKEYYDKNNISVRIDGRLEKELITKSKKALALYRKGINLIFPDIIAIENNLLKDLNNQ